MNNCTLDCIQIMGDYDYGKMCTFVQHQCVQDKVQFIQGFYCLLHGSIMTLVLLGFPFLIVLFRTLNVIAQNYLSPCVEQFIKQFNISQSLAGVTFLAFANGANDVVTAIVAGSSSSSTTALIPFGSIFGACLFSTAFIFSTLIFLLPNKRLTIVPKQIMLPIFFYISGIILIITVTIFYGKMNIYISCVPIILYLIFIVLVLIGQRKQNKKNLQMQSLLSQEKIQFSNNFNQIKQKKIKQLENQQQQQHLEIKQESKISRFDKLLKKFIYTFFVLLIPPFTIQRWKQSISIVSFFLSPILILSTQQIPTIFNKFIGPIPLPIIIYIPSILLLSYTLYCKYKKQQPYFYKPFTLYAFLVIISTITIICSILINFVEMIQILTGANSVFLGLTVLAGANTMGDYLTISHFARAGNTGTAVSGIFSAQLFNFLIGFGASLIIQSLNGQFQYRIFDFQGSKYDKISDAIVMCVIFGGLIYLCLTFITTRIKNGNFNQKEGKIARYYYIVFLLLSSILAILADFFNQISCPIKQ